MKILLFSAQWPEYMIELANALSSHCNTALMIPDNHRFTPKHRELISNKVAFFPFQVEHHNSRIPNWRLGFQILSVILRFKPDIIHVQANGHYAFKTILGLIPRKIKIVNTIHDPILHSGDSLSRKMLDADLIEAFKKRTDLYLVHGEFLRDQLISSYQIEAERVGITRHGHFEIYKKFQSERAKEDNNSILFFGRIWPYKGLEFYIEAANILLEEHPGLTFYIVGKGEDIEKYSSKIVRPKNFKIINERVDLEEAGYYFEKCSFVVLPYVDASQSGVIPVAYAYGKPVVASNVGSLPEVIKEGVTGFLVEPKNSEKLAKRIESILEDDELRQKLSSNAYEFAKTELGWDRIANINFNQYKELKAGK